MMLLTLEVVAILAWLALCVSVAKPRVKAEPPLKQGDRCLCGLEDQRPHGFSEDTCVGAWRV